jgi:hypothetical protein
MEPSTPVLSAEEQKKTAARTLDETFRQQSIEAQDSIAQLRCDSAGIDRPGRAARQRFERNNGDNGRQKR